MLEVMLLGGVVAVVTMVIAYQLKPVEKAQVHYVTMVEFEEMRGAFEIMRSELREELRKKNNQIDRLESLISNVENSENAAVEKMQQELGASISELRKSYVHLNNKVVDENARHRRWQERMYKQTVRYFAKNPIIVDVVNRPEEKNVRAKSRWLKQKDGSYIKETKAIISYPKKKEAVKKKASVRLAEV